MPARSTVRWPSLVDSGHVALGLSSLATSEVRYQTIDNQVWKG